MNRETGGPDRAWLYEAQRVLTPLFRAYFGLRAIGSERLPRRGGVILCPNHASYLDPWFVGHALTDRSWRSLITQRWYERSSALRFLFRAAGVIPTARGRPEETVRRVVDAARAGHAVVVFPEGGISRDGRIRRVRSGVAWMAAASGAPVFPCGIRGNHRAFGRDARLPRRIEVTVHVGDPIAVPPTRGDRCPDPALTGPFLRELTAAIARLARVDVSD